MRRNKRLKILQTSSTDLISLKLKENLDAYNKIVFLDLWIQRIQDQTQAVVYSKQTPTPQTTT